MGGSRSILIILGVVLVLLGIAGFVAPQFTTQQTKNVAQVGDLKLQSNEDTSHYIPPAVAGGAVVLGIILVGGGLYRRA